MKKKNLSETLQEVRKERKLLEEKIVKVKEAIDKRKKTLKETVMTVTERTKWDFYVYGLLEALEILEK